MTGGGQAPTVNLEYKKHTGYYKGSRYRLECNVKKHCCACQADHIDTKAVKEKAWEAERVGRMLQRSQSDEPHKNHSFYVSSQNAWRSVLGNRGVRPCFGGDTLCVPQGLKTDVTYRAIQDSTRLLDTGQGSRAKIIWQKWQITIRLLCLVRVRQVWAGDKTYQIR